MVSKKNSRKLQAGGVAMAILVPPQPLGELLSQGWQLALTHKLLIFPDDSIHWQQWGHVNVGGWQGWLFWGLLSVNGVVRRT